MFCILLLLQCIHCQLVTIKFYFNVLGDLMKNERENIVGKEIGKSQDTKTAITGEVCLLIFNKF